MFVQCDFAAYSFLLFAEITPRHVF